MGFQVRALEQEKDTEEQTSTAFQLKGRKRLALRFPLESQNLQLMEVERHQRKPSVWRRDVIYVTNLRGDKILPPSHSLIKIDYWLIVLIKSKL